ncbi:DUF2807 domain-containing protein [Aurantiacibacter sp. MUD11]|uniref:head GIN domain-containing protein n=1 Tax=Aurantiacibacter sp. MUD11 TaxID=3003265 RepID=UPI0022AAAAB9|nr:head GIN domain-containing protein [Aurantiacibacter sp. MUD11]WAT17209.1 DUF2807 domain-containing protein [Aurantiacibacter sp. MUD11]
MRLGKILGKVVPVVAMVAAAGLSGCGDVDVRFGENEGVPLAELDMSGDPPETVALAAPDNVVITTGEEFNIEVEGSDEAKDRMRFVLEEGTLGISREDGDWRDRDRATVNVTMPPPNSLVMAGSGSITTDAMSDNAEIVIAGSGSITANGLAATDLEVMIAGSGSVAASGSTNSLELNVMGSGSADMADLSVGNGEVNIAGSGDAAFASDGRVEANIMGSGTVRVSGAASCEVNSMGSGTLVCENGTVEGDEEATETEDA